MLQEYVISAGDMDGRREKKLEKRGKVNSNSL